MNLAKNGAVLLAALSAFALTSCGSKTNTLTLAQAMEWLKDADVTKAKTTKVKTETFDWDVKVTGTGMESDADKGLTGGAQFLLSYLIYQDSKLELPEIVAKDELKSLNNKFVDETVKDLPVYDKSEEAEEAEMAFFDADELEDMITDWSDCYGQKIFTKNNLLYVTFNRRETVHSSFGTCDPIDFVQEVAIKKDGFLDHYSAKTNKCVLKGDIQVPKTSVHVVADGTITGDIDVTFQLQ